MAHSRESEFLDLRQQVNQMFEDLVYRPWAIPARTAWRPPVDLYETADECFLVFDLPDVVPEDVRIQAGEQDLVIAGRREAGTQQGVLFQRCERPSGAFERTVRMPRPVVPQQARVEYRHGTCRIHLPWKHSPAGTTERSVVGVEESRCVLRLTASREIPGES